MARQERHRRADKQLDIETVIISQTKPQHSNQSIDLSGMNFTSSHLSTTHFKDLDTIETCVGSYTVYAIVLLKRAIEACIY